MEVVGAAFVVIGIVTLIFYRQGARNGTESHRGLAALIPWLYRLPPSRLTLHRRSMEGITILVGAFFVIAGLTLVIVGLLVE